MWGDTLLTLLIDHPVVTAVLTRYTEEDIGGVFALVMAILDLALQGLAIFGVILFFVLWFMHFLSIIYT